MFIEITKLMSLNDTNRQKGAGLIETMVSLLILGVGLLGVLSLQVNGTTSNQRAVFLTEAQVLAQDMADRIRAFGADGLGARDQQYQGIDTGPRGGAIAYSDQVCDGILSNCNAGQIVDLDEHEWEEALDGSSLPRGQGKVILRNNALNQYIVRILWDQDRTGASTVIGDDEDCLNNEKQRDKTTYLTCYDVVVSLYRD